MTKFRSWYVSLGLVLLVLSVVTYTVHYLIFRDAHHIFIFLLEDIAFIPIHVLLITFIIEKLLNEHEKRATFSKLNMVVGAFFNDVGLTLLKRMPLFDRDPERLQHLLLVNGTWTDKQFFETRKIIQNSDFVMDSQQGDLAELKQLLISKRDFLLRLLENPSLTEYESFTNTVFAVFHLSDELSQRENVTDLPDADYDHLSLDIERSYRGLINEWLRYMNHLKRDYPYLFSLAVRLNPYDPNASAIINNASPKYDESNGERYEAGFEQEGPHGA